MVLVCRRRVCGMKRVFFQAEDGIRDLVRSRGLGDVYKRQKNTCVNTPVSGSVMSSPDGRAAAGAVGVWSRLTTLSLIHI